MSRDRDDVMSFEGIVVETNKGIFKVQTDNGHTVMARLSGKIKLNEIKIIVSDRVIVETSVYDLTNGRICKRLR